MAEASAEATEALSIDVQLAALRLRFPVDERAFEYLLQCPKDVQLKVLQEFDPRNQTETDYSRQLTGFIRSLTKDAGSSGMSRKRPREEVPESELVAFRDKFPMDERAYDYLVNSPDSVKLRIISEFKPKTQGDADYSALVTTMVKRARVEEPVQERQLGGQLSSGGPSILRLRAFKSRYPMDLRAWDFLCSVPGSTQERILGDFKPKREGDSDYSAAVTAFIRAIQGRQPPGLAQGPNRAQLEVFREQFPCDDRAFEFLQNSTPEMQTEVLTNFNPRQMSDSDYSRPLTAFLRKTRDTVTAQQQVLLPKVLHEARQLDFTRAAATVAAATATLRRSGGSRLRNFRLRYPMDMRAYDFLEQAAPEVQDTVIAEFKPRREGESDYSAPVTAFIRTVMLRIESGRANYGRRGGLGGGLGGGGLAGGGLGGGLGGGTLAPARQAANDGMGGQLLSFRRRYPMDERAWDFLSNSSPEVRQQVIERFRPQREGEPDYSRLITSFVKAQRNFAGGGGGGGGLVAP